ncbi:MAG: Hsp20/alpha crystallin family protein [Candidatus Eiseniibacteriota bacterium]|nr:MAG: Hsp20/alpha crystallin family protein [Candidatus Eisenbacteria bacterium]
MALVRWNPWKEALSIDEETDRMFGDLVSGRFGRWFHPERRDSFFSPVVDVSEVDDEYIIRAELPGVKQEDVKVSVHDNTLTIKGEKKLQKEEKEHNFHRMERSYGSFERSFVLGSKVDAGRAKAKYKDGILEIRLAKAEQAKAKDITVE